MEHFFEKINHYTTLSLESRLAWEKTLVMKTYEKGSFFLNEGETPKIVAFVSKGLFSQYSISNKGDISIRKFYIEGSFLASTAALLKKTPSVFAIKAIEQSNVIEYDFADFKKLTKTHLDIAEYYIKHIELHWGIEREPIEMSLKTESAKVRYVNFLISFPQLEKHLKQHEVASYLGITPTQLSRIKKDL